MFFRKPGVAVTRQDRIYRLGITDAAVLVNSLMQRFDDIAKQVGFVVKASTVRDRLNPDAVAIQKTNADPVGGDTIGQIGYHIGGGPPGISRVQGQEATSSTIVTSCVFSVDECCLRIASYQKDAALICCTASCCFAATRLYSSSTTAPKGC